MVLGGLLVVPMGLLAADDRAGRSPTSAAPVDTQAAAARARAIVMEIERGLGFEPTDREFEKLGYDIESRVPGTGQAALHRGEGARVRRGHHHRHQERDPLLAQQARRLHPRHRRVPRRTTTHRVHYLRQPFQREPDFGVTSVNYDFAELLARAEAPREAARQLDRRRSEAATTRPAIGASSSGMRPLTRDAVLGSHAQVKPRGLRLAMRSLRQSTSSVRLASAFRRSWHVMDPRRSSRSGRRCAWKPWTLTATWLEPIETVLDSRAMSARMRVATHGATTVTATSMQLGTR